MEECSKCQMPLGEGDACSCKPEVCYHCCECADDCECGCRQREDA